MTPFEPVAILLAVLALGIPLAFIVLHANSIGGPEVPGNLGFDWDEFHARNERKAEVKCK